MNVVDALVVELGLDTTNFDDNSKRVAEELKKFRESTAKVGADISSQGKKAAEFWSNVKTSILGTMAVFGAATGIKDFIESNLQGQAALSRLSANLDMNASRIEAWGVVATEMGGKAEDSFGALQTVAAGIAEASIKGSSALTNMARANGISLTDSKGHLLSYEEALLAISKRMQQLPRQQALYLANSMGVGAIANDLMLGPDELRKRLDDAEAHSRVTQDSAAAAARLQKNWADLQQRFKEVSELLWTRLEPVLERIGNQFANWLDKVDWDKVVKDISDLAGEADDAAKAFGGWKVVAEALAVVLGLKLASSLLGVVGLITRLIPLGGAAAGGIGSLTTAFQGLGAAAAAINLGAVASVAGIAAAVYSPALGGKQRADGTYSDEPSKAMTNTPKGLDNASLQAAMYGMPSDYKGSREQAALLLAERVYPKGDNPSMEDIQATADEFLRGKRLPKEYGLNMDGPKSPDPSPAPAGDSNAAVFASLEQKYNLPPGLMAKIYKKESANGTNTLSAKGAKGPFQFMDTTAKQYGLNNSSVYDFGASADASAHYLSDLRNQFGGDWVQALGAYNWGPGNVRNKGLANAPAETRDYIQMAKGLQIGPSQQWGGGGKTPNVTSIQIDKIDVHTKATDANGIAGGIASALKNHAAIADMNTGVE